jgi:hypothetical protein
MKNIFLVTIVIKSQTIEWGYEPNKEIIIPVLTNSAYNAERKIDNKYVGSEYPDYEIKSIVKCDNFLFRPIL